MERRLHREHPFFAPGCDSDREGLGSIAGESPVRRRPRRVSTVMRFSQGMTDALASPPLSSLRDLVARNLFVDESCIDCDACRWMQGNVFVRDAGKSAVARQPITEVGSAGSGYRS